MAGYLPLQLGISRLIWIADYESEVRLTKFKIVDPIWRTKMKNLLDWDKI